MRHQLEDKALPQLANQLGVFCKHRIAWDQLGSDLIVLKLMAMMKMTTLSAYGKRGEDQQGECHSGSLPPSQDEQADEVFFKWPAKVLWWPFYMCMTSPCQMSTRNRTQQRGSRQWGSWSVWKVTS